jgi:hypothetical protein
VEPLDERDERGLAAAARPHQRDRLARCDVQRDVVQHPAARARPPVRERHAVEPHLAAPDRHRARRGRVDQRVGGVEDADDRLERHRRATERLVGGGEPLDRPEQPADVAEEGHERAHRHLAADDEVGAHGHRRHPRRRRRDPLPRDLARVHARAAADDLVGVLHAVEEPARLDALHREPLHRADSGQHLVEPAVQRGPPLEQRAVAVRLPGRREDADERGQRGEDQHAEQQSHVEPRHRHHGEGEVGRRRHRAEGELAERGHRDADRLVHLGHRPAHALRLVVRHRELDELRDHPLADREVHGEAHGPRLHVEQAGEGDARELDRHQREHRDAHRARRVAGRGPARRPRERVEEPLERERLAHPDHRERERGRQDAQHRGTVAAHEREGPPHERAAVRPAGRRHDQRVERRGRAAARRGGGERVLRTAS